MGILEMNTYYTRKIETVGNISSRFNELLREKSERVGEHITLQRVALETKLSYNTVIKWAKNQIDRYDKPTMLTLLEYFDCEVGDLLVRERE